MKRTTRRLEKQYRRTQSSDDRLRWRSQFDAQRQLFKQKLRAYWLITIESCGDDSGALWSKLRNMLSPPSQQNSNFSAEQFLTHFTTKIDKIRSTTSTAPPPVIESRHITPFSSFTLVSAEEITRLLSRMPAKHCALDPAPTWIVKRAAGVLAPIFSAMCNISLQTGELPDFQKQAIVFPRLKKPTLDADDINSYRPISNLSFISKLVERVVASRFVAHAEYNKLFPSRQSAYRRHHSTETAVVSLTNDIILAIDSGKVAALVLLDLSAAFDTVDHTTLLEVLRRRFVLDGTPLAWFES